MVGAIWKREGVASQGEGCDVIFPSSYRLNAGSSAKRKRQEPSPGRSRNRDFPASYSGTVDCGVCVVHGEPRCNGSVDCFACDRPRPSPEPDSTQTGADLLPADTRRFYPRFRLGCRPIRHADRLSAGDFDLCTWIGALRFRKLHRNARGSQGISGNWRGDDGAGGPVGNFKDDSKVGVCRSAGLVDNAGTARDR